MFKGRRLWAYILDGIILIAILLTLLSMFAPRDVINDGVNEFRKVAQATKSLPPEEQQKQIETAIKPYIEKFNEKVGPLILATPIAYMVLSIGLETIVGGSLGKKLAGLKVTDKDNNNVTLLTAVQRNLFHGYVLSLPSYLLGGAGLIISLGLLLTWFFMINQKGQTISDIWFGAYVIKKNTSPAELDAKVELN